MQFVICTHTHTHTHTHTPKNFMFNLMRNAQMEINVVLKDEGKVFIVTEFRQMANVKSMSTHADYLRVLPSFIALTLSKRKRIR